MNIAESGGSSSCKGQENGDASNGSERPLKKARFAWQVKGKYHLKHDTNDTSKTCNKSATDPDVAGSSGNGSSSNDRGSEQNLDLLGDYLLKQDFNTLDSVIADPDKSILKPCTSISKDKLQYPRYVSSYDNDVTNNAKNRNSESSKEFDALPLSMVVSQSFSEDQCIARWQARQMAQGFIDNTINNVLDSWIQVPVPPEEDGSRFLALDVADFINNLPGDNSIENEGILMAISAHGLQNTANSSSSSHSSSQRDCETSIATNYPSSPQRSLSPLPSDDESHELLNNNNQCDTDTSNELDIPWSYSDHQKNEANDVSPFPLFPDTSNLSYQYENHQNSVVDSDENISDNHCDFLDAAVMFAIQSKGLTTFGLDYG